MTAVWHNGDLSKGLSICHFDIHLHNCRVGIPGAPIRFSLPIAMHDSKTHVPTWTARCPYFSRDLFRFILFSWS